MSMLTSASKSAQVPEETILVAAHTGSGWSLEVHNQEGAVVAFLAWPENWPAKMQTHELEKAGFLCV